MMHSKDEFMTIHIGRSTWQGLKSELKTNSGNPERIWAFPWYGKEGYQGQWDYFDTSPHYGTMVAEYVRADLHDALTKDRDELAAELRVYMDAAEAHMVEHMRTIDQAQAEIARLTLQRDDLTTMIKGLSGDVADNQAEITQLRAELAAERELAANLCFTLSAFVAKYGGTNAARQVKDYRDHCTTRRNK